MLVSQGECPSFGINGSYVVWRPVWNDLLGVDARATVDSLAAALRRAGRGPPPPPPPPRSAARDRDPGQRAHRIVRREGSASTSLEATLADWLRTTADHPRLIVLEDCHWIDPLSEDLLEVVGRAVREVPVCVVVTHRARGESEGGPLSVGRGSRTTERSGSDHWRTRTSTA